MPIITRQENGAPLTWSQMDQNLTYLSDSIDSLTQSNQSLASAISELIFDTTIVELLPADILSLGTPIELLPSPGAGNYYLIDRIVIEYKYRTTQYAFPASQAFYLDGCFDSYVDRSLLTSNTDTVCVITGNLRNTYQVGSGSGSTFVKTNKDILNANLVIGTQNGDNPTSGDGSMRIIIKYKRVAFDS